MINTQPEITGALLRLQNMRTHAEEQEYTAHKARYRHNQYASQIMLASDRRLAIAYLERFARCEIAIESYNALCDCFLRDGYMPTAYSLARECFVPEDNGARRLRRLIELCVVERTKGGIWLVDRGELK